MSNNSTGTEMNDIATHAQPDFWQAVRRGFMGRCPECGKGHLLRRYLKQVERCPNCGEDFSEIRADDGPAWLTIVIVGHIFAPILLFAIPGSTWPDWVSMIVWPGLAFVLALVLLPRCKGVFITMIWRSNLPAARKQG